MYSSVFRAVYITENIIFKTIGQESRRLRVACRIVLIKNRKEDLLMNCNICGNRIQFLSGCHSLSDGAVCGNCMKRIPKCIRHAIGKYSVADINSIIGYIENINREDFVPTESFGNLHIDGIHGLFAIGDNINSLVQKGKHKEITDIFNCLSLSDVSLLASNIKYNRNRNVVVCDFDFYCRFEYPRMDFKVTVNRGVACLTKRTSKTELSYSLPGNYHVFLEVFNQMLDTARRKYMDASVPKFISKPAFDLFKAETLFMLSDGYDMEEVETQRERLCGAFSDDGDYLRIIDHAYRILSGNVVGR